MSKEANMDGQWRQHPTFNGLLVSAPGPTYSTVDDRDKDDKPTARLRRKMADQARVKRIADLIGAFVTTTHVGGRPVVAGRRAVKVHWSWSRRIMVARGITQERAAQLRREFDAAEVVVVPPDIDVLAHLESLFGAAPKGEHPPQVDTDAASAQHPDPSMS